MLWEMLAGRRMWHGMTEVEIVAHLASNQPLPPLPSDGSLPAGLEAICTRALDLDPDRRYQTAAELELELEGVLAGAADSHARNLGKVVSLAFDVELRRAAGVHRTLCRPADVSDARRPHDDPRGGAARHRRDAVRPGSQCGAASTIRRSLPPRVPWLRRAAAVAALAAVALVIALVDGGRTTVRFPSVAVPASSAAPPSRGMPGLAARRPEPVVRRRRPAAPSRPAPGGATVRLCWTKTQRSHPARPAAAQLSDQDDDPRH